jgi:antigen flippase
VSTETSSGGSSYGQILKSSSIIGGAQAINYIIGLVRMKFVAVLLGPSGVGLVGLYVSVIGLVQTFAQLGINESGVREVAVAAGSGDDKKIAQTVAVLRRACWFTGLFGWALAVTLAWPLSQWTFGSTEHAWALAVLGSVVLLELVAGGQKALLQGVRRIGDLARLQVATALLTTVVAVVVYWWMRERGIVTVIVLTSVIQLLCSWWIVRRIKLPPVAIGWRETWRHASSLLKLGSAFMYGAILTSVVGLAIRALIVRDLGLDAAGIYQAAWALSGMFGGFVLQAMATDFYPRLSALAHDNSGITRLVNEQIEIGLLLALPGVIAAISLSPLLLDIFYSSKFASGNALMPWFVLGVLGQVVSWPMGMILQAKGATAWLYISRSQGAVLHLVLTMTLLAAAGLLGVAWAFAAYAWIQMLVVFVITRKLVHLKVSGAAYRLLSLSLVLSLFSLALLKVAPSPWGIIGTLFLALLTGLMCARSLALRVGYESRLGRLLHRIAFLPQSGF